jgi:hypothetical protein
MGFYRMKKHYRKRSLINRNRKQKNKTETDIIDKLFPNTKNPSVKMVEFNQMSFTEDGYFFRGVDAPLSIPEKYILFQKGDMAFLFLKQDMNFWTGGSIKFAPNTPYIIYNKGKIQSIGRTVISKS